jgi:hypothetical protein
MITPFANNMSLSSQEQRPALRAPRIGGSEKERRAGHLRSEVKFFMRRLSRICNRSKLALVAEKRHQAAGFCRHAEHGCRVKIVLDFEDRNKLFETIVLGREKNSHAAVFEPIPGGALTRAVVFRHIFANLGERTRFTVATG